MEYVKHNDIIRLEHVPYVINIQYILSSPIYTARNFWYSSAKIGTDEILTAQQLVKFYPFTLCSILGLVRIKLELIDFKLPQ